jgi:hypothetical protein
MPQLANHDFHERQQQIPRLVQDAVLCVGIVIDYNVPTRVARISGAGPIRLAIDCRGSASANVGMFGVDVYEPLVPGTRVIVAVKKNDAYIIGTLPTERWPSTAFTYPVDISTIREFPLASDQAAIDGYRYFQKTGFASQLTGLMPGDYALASFTGNRFLFSPFYSHLGDASTHLSYSFFDQTLKLAGARLDFATPFYHLACYAHQQENYHVEVSKGDLSGNCSAFVEFKGSLANEGHTRMLVIGGGAAVFENIGLPGTYHLLTTGGILLGVTTSLNSVARTGMPYQVGAVSHLTGYRYNACNKGICASNFMSYSVQYSKALYPEFFIGRAQALAFERFIAHTGEFAVATSGNIMGSYFYIADDGSIALVSSNGSYIAIDNTGGIILNSLTSSIKMLAPTNIVGISDDIILRGNGVAISSSTKGVGIRAAPNLQVYSQNTMDLCSGVQIRLLINGLPGITVMGDKIIASLPLQAEFAEIKDILAKNIVADLVVADTFADEADVEVQSDQVNPPGCSCPYGFPVIIVERSIGIMPAGVEAPNRCIPTGESKNDILIYPENIPGYGTYISSVSNNCQQVQHNFRQRSIGNQEPCT